MIKVEFEEVIKKRRSIRRFEGRKIESWKISRILEMAFYAPSSYNHRPWHLIMVKDKDLLEKLSQAKLDAEPLKHTPLAIVIGGDERKSDVWVEDCSILAEHIQLAAVSLGLGSFWVQIRNRSHKSGESAENYIRKTLKIPANIRVVCIIGLGYPAEKKREHRKEEIEILLRERVYLNTYQ